MKIVRNRLLYPILFSIYPVLALLVHNADEVPLSYGLRSLVMALVATAVMWSILRLILHSWGRAALVCTWLLLLFFSYGHIYGYFEQVEGVLRQFGRHRLLLPIWLILTVVGIWWLSRKSRRPSVWIYPLNVIALLLVSMQLIQLIGFEWQVFTTQGQELPMEVAGLNLSPDQSRPDVYYIILDAYAREDELNHTFAYDNSPFLDALEDMGFYVASCSQSNYAQTMLSLSSSLNMNYLEELASNLGPASDSRFSLRALIKHSKTRDLFEQLGYSVVAFETGFRWTQWDDADIYLSPQIKTYWDLNNFEIMLIRTTWGLVPSDLQSLRKLPHIDLDTLKKVHYHRLHYTFDQLETISQDYDSPKFVFVHILGPHSPQVLDQNGEMIIYPENLDSPTYVQAYRDELIYINLRLEEIIRNIIAESETPPVIILQADHGHEYASKTTRMEILNAYYFQGENADWYATISPVNTFRLLFDYLYGGNYELLEDKSYFSYYQTPYEYIPIPNECIP